MSVSVDFAIDSTRLDAILVRMDSGFSAAGWAGFLGLTVGPYLQQRAQARFATEGDDVTGPWQPLQATTNEFRKAQGFPAVHPINKRTGEMENYVTGGSGAAVPLGTVAELDFPNPGTKLGGDLLTKVKTAQGGKTSPRTPPRPVIGLGVQDEVFVIAEMALYAQKVMR